MQVKFLRNGETKYGEVRQYCEDGKKAIAKGEYIVDDAILPVAYRIKMNEATEIPMRWDMLDEYQAYVKQCFKDAANLSDQLGDKVTVGKLFALGVADGCAWYIVTKVNRKTCVVEWRGFELDRYTDRWLGYGKKINITDVQPYVVGRINTRLRVSA